MPIVSRCGITFSNFHQRWPINPEAKRKLPFQYAAPPPVATLDAQRPQRVSEQAPASPIGQPYNANIN